MENILKKIALIFFVLLSSFCYAEYYMEYSQEDTKGEPSSSITSRQYHLIIAPEDAETADTPYNSKAYQIMMYLFGTMDPGSKAGSLICTPSNTLPCSSLMGNLFSTFNGGILVIAVGMLGYVMLQSAFSDAGQGLASGQKYSHKYIPFRSALGVSLIVPTATGYSLSQIIIVKIILLGSSAATTLWHYLLDYHGAMGAPIGSGELSYNGGSTMGGGNIIAETFVQNMSRLAVCNAYMNTIEGRNSQYPSNPPPIGSIFVTQITTSDGVNYVIKTGVEGVSPSESYSIDNSTCPCGTLSIGPLSAGDYTILANYESQIVGTGYNFISDFNMTTDTLSEPVNYRNQFLILKNLLKTDLLLNAYANSKERQADSSSKISAEDASEWFDVVQYIFRLLKKSNPSYGIALSQSTVRPPVLETDPALNAVIDFSKEVVPSSAANLKVSFPGNSGATKDFQAQLDVMFTATEEEGDALLGLASVGRGFLIIAFNLLIVAFIFSFIVVTLSSIASDYISASTFGGAAGVMTVIGAVIQAIGFIVPIASVFAIGLPLVPLATFTSAILTWVFFSVIAVVSAPIICLGMISHGDGLGRAGPALMIIVNLFMRPSLNIIGFVAGAKMFNIFYLFFTQAFVITVNDVMGTIGVDDSTLMSLTSIIFLYVYTFFIAAGCTRCYGLIYLLPDRFLSWIGAAAISIPESTQGAQASQRSLQTATANAQDGFKNFSAGAQRVFDSAHQEANKKYADRKREGKAEHRSFTADFAVGASAFGRFTGITALAKATGMDVVAANIYSNVGAGVDAVSSVAQNAIDSIKASREATGKDLKKRRDEFIDAAAERREKAEHGTDTEKAALANSSFLESSGIVNLVARGMASGRIACTLNIPFIGKKEFHSTTLDNTVNVVGSAVGATLIGTIGIVMVPVRSLRYAAGTVKHAYNDHKVPANERTTALFKDGVKARDAERLARYESDISSPFKLANAIAAHGSVSRSEAKIKYTKSDQPLDRHNKDLTIEERGMRALGDGVMASTDLLKSGVVAMGNFIGKIPLKATDGRKAYAEQARDKILGKKVMTTVDVLESRQKLDADGKGMMKQEPMKGADGKVARDSLGKVIMNTVPDMELVTVQKPVVSRDLDGNIIRNKSEIEGKEKAIKYTSAVDKNLGVFMGYSANTGSRSADMVLNAGKNLVGGALVTGAGAIFAAGNTVGQLGWLAGSAIYARYKGEDGRTLAEAWGGIRDGMRPLGLGLTSIASSIYIAPPEEKGKRCYEARAYDAIVSKVAGAGDAIGQGATRLKLGAIGLGDTARTYRQESSAKKEDTLNQKTASNPNAANAIERERRVDNFISQRFETRSRLWNVIGNTATGTVLTAAGAAYGTVNAVGRVGHYLGSNAITRGKGPSWSESWGEIRNGMRPLGLGLANITETVYGGGAPAQGAKSYEGRMYSGIKGTVCSIPAVGSKLAEAGANIITGTVVTGLGAAFGVVNSVRLAGYYGGAAIKNTAVAKFNGEPVSTDCPTLWEKWGKESEDGFHAVMGKGVAHVKGVIVPPLEYVKDAAREGALSLKWKANRGISRATKSIQSTASDAQAGFKHLKSGAHHVYKEATSLVGDAALEQGATTGLSLLSDLRGDFKTLKPLNSQPKSPPKPESKDPREAPGEDL